MKFHNFNDFSMKFYDFLKKKGKEEAKDIKRKIEAAKESEDQVKLQNDPAIAVSLSMSKTELNCVIRIYGDCPNRPESRACRDP